MNERAVLAIQGQDLKPPFDFVVMGDPQGYYEAAGRLLAAARRFHPAFTIFMGDLTPGGQEEDYQRYVALIRSATMPVLSVIGNHDAKASGGREAYERIFGKPDFCFDAGRRRFVVFDTNGERLTASQLAWLASVLNGRQRSYVFTHRPPYMGNWWYHSFVGGTAQFLKMVERGQVPWVFLGHLHVLDGLTWNGTRFLVVGSGGIIPDSLPQGKPVRCLVRVRVMQDGEQLEVYGLQGERIELPSDFFN
jgi:Icc-related predicted phosphoesterase